MTPADRQQFRQTLLRILDANTGRYHFTTATLRVQVRSEGHSDATNDDVKAELLYLADKGMVEKVAKEISPEVAEWRITAKGRDAYAELSNE